MTASHGTLGLLAAQHGEPFVMRQSVQRARREHVQYRAAPR